MKGLNNFHATILVIALVAGIFAVIWGLQARDETPDLLTPPQVPTSPRALSAAEIRDLFSGQIVEGVHEIQGFDFAHYYGGDGSLISVRSDRGKTNGTWRVLDDDRLCIHLRRGQEICREVMQIEGVTKKFVKTRSGDTKIVVTFKSFRAGGPGDI